MPNRVIGGAKHTLADEIKKWTVTECRLTKECDDKQMFFLVRSISIATRFPPSKNPNLH